MESEDKAKITIEEKITAKSVDSVFETFVKSFEEVGFTIWKKRPIAWLCISKMDTDDKHIDANLALRPTSPITATLVMSSTTSSEEELNQLSEELLSAFYTKLGSGK